MESDDALTVLTALSHPTRLAAFRLLVDAGQGGLPVGALRERLDVPAPTLTAHLHVLRAAGLVLDRREGRVINVRAGFGRVDALVGFLMRNCCAGDDAGDSLDCGPKTGCGPTRSKPR